ncbi:type II secretion system protein GspM [uncultured Tateyamaria sp.]|uniref:type II secretion system protein GspM n=1 Tax=Tateyamaria sp. 1078 TaxID=3417464 RepID=UPI00261022A0|nr:type II secretion system protein GspM [uncultured Tateyamaria sp.]
MNALVDMLAARTGRERMLLAALVVLGLPALIYVAVLEPAWSARADALRARDEALALNAWVAARAAEAPALTPQVVRTAPAPIGSTGIEETLIAAQLRGDVSDLGLRENGVIELRFDSVTFTRLANWLSEEAPHWGYALGTFRILATDAPGKVSATLVLTP